MRRLTMSPVLFPPSPQEPITQVWPHSPANSVDEQDGISTASSPPITPAQRNQGTTRRASTSSNHSDDMNIKRRKRSSNMFDAFPSPTLSPLEPSKIPNPISISNSPEPEQSQSLTIKTPQ